MLLFSIDLFQGKMWSKQYFVLLHVGVVHHTSWKSSEMQPAKSRHLHLTCDIFIWPSSDPPSTLLPCKWLLHRTRSLRPISPLPCSDQAISAWGAAQGPIFTTCKGGLLRVSKNLLTQPVASWFSFWSLSAKVLLLTLLRTWQAGSGRRGSVGTRAVAQRAGASAMVQPALSSFLQSPLTWRVKHAGCHKSWVINWEPLGKQIIRVSSHSDQASKNPRGLQKSWSLLARVNAAAKPSSHDKIIN